MRYTRVIEKGSEGGDKRELVRQRLSGSEWQIEIPRCWSSVLLLLLYFLVIVIVVDCTTVAATAASISDFLLLPLQGLHTN